jgi:S-adenosylmethionine synthetase
MNPRINNLIYELAMNILITGASGLLGRPLLSLLTEKLSTQPEHRLKGWVFQRPRPQCDKVDITNPNVLLEALEAFQPDIILHTAAERRPDVSEKDPDGTERLNVKATRDLAKWCEKNRSNLLYLSTDYVFDGTLPPYGTDHKPHPLNGYGHSKLAGEKAVLENCTRSWVLRVPILYGPVENWDESPVTALIHSIQKKAPTVPVEAWAVRYPTCTLDLAKLLSIWTRAFIESRLTPDYGIYHFSAKELHTKYSMALLLAECLGLPSTHLHPDPSAPSGAPRPQNSCLDTSRLAEYFQVSTRTFKSGLEESLRLSQLSLL